MVDKEPKLSEWQKKLRTEHVLVRHNYGLFLERQARLHATAYSRRPYLTDDLADRANLLLLDDLTIFAISGRRLMDMCHLQSHCGKKILVQPIRPVISGDVLHFVDNGERVGFYSLCNRLIHLTYFQYFTRNSSVWMMCGPKLDYTEFSRRRADPKDQIDGVFALKESDYPMIIMRLKDVMVASAEAADKIVEVCGHAQIFLELNMAQLDMLAMSYRGY